MLFNLIDGSDFSMDVGGAADAINYVCVGN